MRSDYLKKHMKKHERGNEYNVVTNGLHDGKTDNNIVTKGLHDGKTEDKDEQISFTHERFIAVQM